MITLSATMLGLAWLGVVLFAPPPPTHLRRYVSPPQPDGERYTFLYPDRLHPERMAGASLCLSRPMGLRERLAEFWNPYRWQSDARSEVITVKSTPFDPSHRRGWRRGRVVGFHPSPYQRFEAAFNDSLANRCDCLLYSWHLSQSSVCADISGQIITSFQFLEPGEDPPADAMPRAADPRKKRSSAGNALAGRQMLPSMPSASRKQ